MPLWALCDKPFVASFLDECAHCWSLIAKDYCFALSFPTMSILMMLRQKLF